MDKNVVIITRHNGVVEWLNRKGFSGKAIEHADASAVQGKVVVGNLPLHLACLCKRIGSIDMPLLPLDARGKDLSPEEMDKFGAALNWYEVRNV